MNDIQSRIQQIEEDIKMENFSIKYQLFLLKECGNWSTLIPFAVISGALLGYFLPAKKLLAGIIPTIAITTVMAIRAYKTVKLLLLIPN